MEATTKKLGLPLERMVSTVGEHANTSAASIPLALDVAVRDGRIRPGQHVHAAGRRRRFHLGLGSAAMDLMIIRLPHCQRSSGQR